MTASPSPGASEDKFAKKNRSTHHPFRTAWRGVARQYGSGSYGSPFRLPCSQTCLFPAPNGLNTALGTDDPFWCFLCRLLRPVSSQMKKEQNEPGNWPWPVAESSWPGFVPPCNGCLLSGSEGGICCEADPPARCESEPLISLPRQSDNTARLFLHAIARHRLTQYLDRFSPLSQMNGSTLEASMGPSPPPSSGLGCCGWLAIASLSKGAIFGR